jgi:hypothetical protein
MHRRISFTRLEQVGKPLELQGSPGEMTSATGRTEFSLGTILNQIYEEDFLGSSYGFRPGRSQHDALDALAFAIRAQEGELHSGLRRSQLFRQSRLISTKAGCSSL